MVFYHTSFFELIKIKVYTIIQLSVVLLFCTTYLFCSTTIDEKLEKINVQLKWKHQFQFAGFYAAIEKGYYKEADLEVNLVEGKSGINFINEVTSGKANYGVETPQLLISRAQGIPIVVLGVIFQHSPSVLFTDKSEGLNTLEKLNNRTIMLRAGSSAEIIAMLKNEKIYDKVNIVQHTWNYYDVLNKKVSGSGAYITDRSYIQENIEDKFYVLNPINYGIDFYGDCIFTSESEIENNPERVEKFINATFRGWEYALKNIDETIDLIINKYNQSAQRENLVYEAEKMKELIFPDLVKMGYMNPGRWQHILNTYKKLGMIDENYEIEGFLYQHYLETDSVLLKKMVTIITVIIVVLCITIITILTLKRNIKIATNKILETEYKYRLLFEKSEDAVCIINKRNNKFISANKSAEILIGKKEKELREFSIKEVNLLGSDNRFEEIKNLDEVKDFGELLLKRGDGSSRRVLLSAMPIDKDCYFIIAKDITEIRKSEKSLQDSETRSKALLKAIPDMMFRLDRSGIYIDYQAGENELYSANKDDIIGKNYKDIIPEELADLFENKIEALFETGETQTIRYKLPRKNSEATEFEARIVRSGANEVLAIVRDITKEKENEEKIKAQQLKFKTFFSSVNDAIFVHPLLENGFGNFIEVNDAACKRYGYTRNEFLMMTARDITIRSDAEVHSSPEYRKRLKQEKSKIFETVHITKSGEKFPVEISSNVVDQLGKPYLIAIVRDISERKEAEKKIKQSEEKYKALFQNTKSILLLIDPQNQEIVDANQAAVDFYGYPEKQLIGMKISDINIMSPEEIQAEIELCKNNKKNHFDFVHKLANDELKHIEVYSGPVIHEDKELLYSIIHDVTKQKEAEKALIEIQRLNAIGEIATAVAHDFNNSLQMIMGNIELAMLTKGLPDKTWKYLNNIKVSTEDASTRVSLLQRFGEKKQTKSEYDQIDLNKVIKDVINQTRPLWKDDIEKNEKIIEVEQIVNKIPNISGNEAELRSVLYNLIKNSIEAIQDGGKITFETKLINDEVLCLISDNGIGMDQETKLRAIQPFFTTKGNNIGRGLGLSGAFGIVKEHLGELTILETAPNKGCVIQISFPKTEIMKKEHRDKLSKPLEELNILWVDDEPSLRESGLEFLKILGQKGFSAKNGIEALELLESNKIDLVITDIGMPGMSGWQLTDKIKEKYLDKIKVGVMTGWGEEVEEKAKINHHIEFVLSKPFKCDQLKKIINDVIKNRKDK